MESLLEVSHKPLSMGVGPFILYRKKRGAMCAPCLTGNLGWSPEAQERGQSWYLRHVGDQLKWSTCLGMLGQLGGGVGLPLSARVSCLVR
ncbi:unnamed protein product [Prunus armeniaca]